MVIGLAVGCQSGSERSGSTASSTAATATAPREGSKAAAEANKNLKQYAIIETSMGTIRLELFADKVPNTAANFVGLAEGTKKWTHQITGPKIRKPFYDGLTFHRVIPGYIIQAGDPIGTGQGNPGYQFNDEIVPDLKFDKPGVLAMANFGPNTNGSQFFITIAPAPHLNGKYTIFGRVVEGQKVVNAIANVPRDPQTFRPLKPVFMRKVTIERVPIAQSGQPSEGGKKS
ncbi:MAG: peptidylprolyl isomerase [Acidobacteria bacterium]|nr:peptidylprolyl isomerase [Acidobacteriota bacterium]